MAIIIHKERGEAKEAAVHALIDGTNGQFFGAGFVKADGTPREGQFRTKVVKHVKGVGMSYDPRARGLRTLWEANNREGCTGADSYRNFKVSTLTFFRANGDEHRFE